MEKLQIIKSEKDNTTFIWKHPEEYFFTGSQLIVYESQEAIFFMNGQALDLFPPGRHTLETQNLPLLHKFFSSFTKDPLTGEKSPFQCSIYFINKTEQMAILWGTDSRVEFLEPTYNFPINIGAKGEMSLRAEDSRRLLIKVVGTEKDLTQQMLVQKFRAFLMTHIKTYLAHLIREYKINIFSIDEYLTEISQALHARLAPDFMDYGIALERFFLTSIDKPEDDKTYQRYKDLYFRQYADIAEAELRQKIGIIDQKTQAERMVIEAQSLAQKRMLEGYTYKDERAFDVAERIAANEAVGEISNIGVGLGMLTGVSLPIGEKVGGIMKDTMGNLQNPEVHQNQNIQTILCPNCEEAVPEGSNFCPNCGNKVTNSAKNEFKCPRCGELVPKSKFCKNCGAPLTKICPNCQSEIDIDSKYCPQCRYEQKG
jgi:membrane protease subunit (stomatin/prohibitin family)